MALQKVISSVRQQMHRMLIVSSRLCSNESVRNQSKIDSIFPIDEDQVSENETRSPGFNCVNEVFVTGQIVGEVFATTQGSGVTFLLDIFQNGRYGDFKVRTRVVLNSALLPGEGKDGLREGQRIFLKGRLGSKVERSADGSSIVRSTHVVARHINLL